jgi:predicted metallo-beta-lactamase superfamily hydrolase
MPKKVVVLIKDKERSYEGLRSSLGLLLDRHVVSMIVLDHEVVMDEAYQDNMGFIDEMGGARYSNVGANVEKYGFQPLAVDAIPAKLQEFDLVVAY